MRNEGYDATVAGLDPRHTLAYLDDGARSLMPQHGGQIDLRVALHQVVVAQAKA